MNKYKINNDCSFLKILDLLHDARLHIETIKYDKNTKKWEALFQRENFDSDLTEETRFLFFFRKISTPLINTKLILRGVEKFQLTDLSNIGIYTFNKYKKTKSGYDLEFCEEMNIKIDFMGEPSGELEDISISEKKGSYFSAGASL
jgi:hypothetical protein